MPAINPEDFVPDFRYVLEQTFRRDFPTPQGAEEVGEYHYEGRYGSKYFRVWKMVPVHACDYVRKRLENDGWAKAYTSKKEACQVADEATQALFLGMVPEISDPSFYYTLDTRQLKDTSEYLQAACVFCGKIIEHVNEGGVGCIAGSLELGHISYHLYCNDPICMERLLAENSGCGVKTCSCEGYHMYDVLGSHCHICGKECQEPGEEQES